MFQKTIELLMQELQLTIGIILAGLAGAFLSLAIVGVDASFRMRFFSVTGGIFLSWFGAPAVTDYWNITSGAMSTGIALVLGLYGLSVVKELADLIRSGALRFLLPTKLRGKDSESA